MKNTIEREKINISKNLKLKYLLSAQNNEKVNSNKRKSDYKVTNSNLKYCKNNESSASKVDNIYKKLNLKRLDREFYMTDAVDLAKKLIGKILVRKLNDSYITCKIVETEAYMGPHDKAAHSYNNKKTERTKHFWATGGKLYVYGIHQCKCVNIVANEDTKPEAVLIRGLEPLEGIEILKDNRKSTSKLKSESSKIINLTNGPGKICEALKIDISHNGLDCCNSEEIFVTYPEEETDLEIDRSTRININYAKEYIYKPWRFFIKNNPFISKAKIEHAYKDD